MIKIKNLTDKAEVYIYGVIIDDVDANWLIGEDGDVIGYQWPTEIRQQLDDLKGLPIDVHIASDGGDVAAGISIYNMLANHDAPVEVYIDSWAASIASVIAFAGNGKIHMADNTFLMIHNPRGGGFGDADYLRSIADWLSKIKDMIVNTYAKFANISVDEIKALMDKEAWLPASECKAIFGEKIDIMEQKQIEAVAMLKSTYKGAPDILKPIEKKTEDNAQSSNDNQDKKVSNDGNENIKNNIISVLRRSFAYEEESRDVTAD